MGKGSAKKFYCTISLPHARPTMHCIPLVYLYIYIFIYLYIYIFILYIWYVRIPYIRSALFVRDVIFPRCTLDHVASHSCSRDETRKTEQSGESTQQGLEKQ